ncbi:MAG: carbamoyltransferase HypF [Armatimonadota bacterium]|nr:carbamoyltransferase HypF [Armatimonadota bacterium]
MDADVSNEHSVRKIICVSGVVQGVGFRPFVASLASRYGLRGWVRNTSGSVEIEIEGSPEQTEAFVSSLSSEAPPLARITSVSAIEADPSGYTDFEILQSTTEEPNQCVIPADIAICSDCMREIRDPEDRRYHYAFTNCTNCGPRFTIVRRVPYDRANTTMASFKMCPSCDAEYRDPHNRRFHAEPTACPQCGPRIWLECEGEINETDPLRKVGELLFGGRIVAIKGLGGFHLACDARSDGAVRMLRARKGRSAKPFAIMVRDISQAELVCELTPQARELLISRQRPIVLARKKPSSGISDQVAPANKNLGVMLPYTPLHVLLLEHSPAALVMTSGNLSEEPLVFTNQLAREKLAGLADAFLMHDRDIHVPCDDSVVRADYPDEPILIRRARGYVPDAIDLPFEAPEILAVGAEQKNTFCLAWGRQAVVSQHIGDLDTAETLDYFKYAVDHFLALFGKRPQIVAHDLHPEYMSTHYAKETPVETKVAVQHHHAHIAACLAENARTDRCIGIALDGTGYGTDGTVWGGELLAADPTGFERIGRLAPIRMPGGEAAIRDPRKMAAAYLYRIYQDDWWKTADVLGLGFTEFEIRVIKHQLETGFNSPVTSSAGRLFDAVSAALGVCRERSYEGQAAAELEAAIDEAEEGSYPGALYYADGLLTLDFTQVFRCAVEEFLNGTPASTAAARFHNSLADTLVEACKRIRDATGLSTVALSGGVFQNAFLTRRLSEQLRACGFEVLRHRLLPPNDACISFGQAVVAAATRQMKG